MIELFVPIGLFVLLLVREFQNWTEVRDWRKYYKAQEQNWCRERAELINKIWATSEDQRLQIIELEKRRLDIRQMDVDNEGGRIKYISSIPGDGLDLQGQAVLLEEAKRELAELEAEKDKDIEVES